MKSVLLVTLQSVNIGNRLQNYALQTVLEKMNCQIGTPFYDKHYDTFIKEIKFVAKILLACIGVKKYKSEWMDKKREERFEAFDRAYIKGHFPVSFRNIKKRDWDKYDYAVTGSDQVWHGWSGQRDELEYFYLQFIEKEKRIAYAPSFGFQNFPKEQIELHRTGIMGLKAISCREEEGCRMIENLTGKKAELLLDPTFLLSADDWKKLETKPEHIPQGKYILLYFLGERSIEYKAMIKRTEQELNATIVDVFSLSDVKYYCVTPDEFVWLVEHSEYVLTDSFHACVFSIIFQKDFLVFPRICKEEEGQITRIDSLLTLFHMKEHIYSGIEQPIKINSDYDRMERIRQEWAEKSIRFLEKYLK